MTTRLRRTFLIAFLLFVKACMSVCGQADDSLTTTNQDRIEFFWQALERGNGPVTVVAFGDSVSDDYRSIQTCLFQRLQAEFGCSGYSFQGMLSLGLQLGGGASQTGPTTNWWLDHWSLPPGGSAFWTGPQAARCDQVGVFWVAHPGGGSFALSVSTNGGPWSGPLAVLDGYALAPAGRYTNVPLARDNYRLRVDGIGGTNLILGPQLLDRTSTGLHIAFMAKDGQSLDGVFSVSTNILYPILSALNPQLTVWHMKEVGDAASALVFSNRLYDLEALWKAGITNGDVVYIGTPYDGSAEFAVTQNQLLRQAAVRDRRAYVDCMKPCVSFSWMTSHALLADGTHPSNLCDTFLANTVVWPQLGLDKLVLGQPLDNDGPLVMPQAIGGDPLTEVYGWAVWNPREAELVLRNPSSQTGFIVLDPETAFQLSPRAPTVYDLQPVYPGQQCSVSTLQAGNPAPVVLDPNEVLVLKAQPRPAYETQILEAGPLAYWRLGESNGPTAFDQVGSHYGLFVNVTNHVLPGALLQDDDGAVHLSGADSHVLITNGAAFNFTGTSPFTLTAWVQLDQLGGRQRLLSNLDPAGGGYSLGIDGQSNLLLTAFGSDEAEVNVGPIPTGRWCQVTVVRRAGTVEFYWNGASAGTNTISTVQPSASPLQLGGNPVAGPGEEPLTGDLDEVAVFSRALAPAEIQALYQEQVAPVFPPLITSQPTGLTRYLGCTARFSAGAAGSLPMSYQWCFHGSAMLAQTNTSLLLSNLSATAAGNYSLTVSNVAGMATSSPAVLALRTPEIYVAPVLADHPVAYWRLDESNGPTVFDSWGNHDGTALGNVLFQQFGAIPYFSQACVHFDATPGTQIDVPYTAELDPPVFSIECWVRVTGGPNRLQSPLASRDVNPTSGYWFAVTSDNHWSFQTGNGTTNWQSIPGPEVLVGNWTFLAGTFDGTNQSFYVNGELVAATSASFQPNLQRPFRIGAGATESAGDDYFNGDADEVALFDYALSPAQVQQHYQAAFSAPAATRFSIQPVGPNLMLLWPTGRLEQAEMITGPWFPVTNAASPWLVSPTAPAQFFRLRN